MKEMRHVLFLSAAVFSGVQAHAQEVPRAIVSLSSVNDGIVQGVDVSFQLLGFESSQVSNDNHPLHEFWSTLVARATKHGAVSAGFDRGVGRSSIQLRFPSWPEGTPLADAQSPKPWRDLISDTAQVSRAFSAFRPLPANEWDFLRFHWKGGADLLRKVALCATLPYLSEVKAELKIPSFVATLQKRACTSTPVDVPLTFSPNDWGTDDELPPPLGNEPATPEQVLVSETFSPEFLSLQLPFEEICSEESVRLNIDALVGANWVSPVRPGSGPLEIGQASAECSRTLGTKVFSRMGESLQEYASRGTFRGATPWLQAKLSELARMHPEKWITGKKVAEAILADTLQSTDAPHGFSRERFELTRDLNISGGMSQAQQGGTTVQILGALLSPENEDAARSPWRRELESLPSESQKAYLAKLIDGLVTSKCTDASGRPANVTMGCLAESLGSIDAESSPLFEFALDGEARERLYGIVAH